MKFKISNVIGHDRELRFLEGMFNTGRIPSGMIFHGQKNIGKRFAATSFAASVLCRDYSLFESGIFRGGTGKGAGTGLEEGGCIAGYPCGRCPSCAGILNDSNPNLFILEPSGNYIKLEKIKELNRALGLKPSFDTSRFVIIDDAPSMNHSAMNALLKLLEEPPGRTYFILIASNLNGLLPTIVSRCSLLAFSTIPEKVLFESFRLKYGDIDEKILAVYSRIACGSYSAMENLLGGGYFEERNGIIEGIFKEKPDGGTGENYFYDLAESYSSSPKKTGGKTSSGTGAGGPGKNPPDTEKRGPFEILLYILRDMYIYKNTRNESLLYNCDIPEKFKEFIASSALTGRDLLEMIDLTLSYLNKADFNVNKTIAADSYFSRLLSIVRP